MLVVNARSHSCEEKRRQLFCGLNGWLISKENKFQNYVSEIHMIPQKYKHSR